MRVKIIGNTGTLAATVESGLAHQPVLPIVSVLQNRLVIRIAFFNQKAQTVVAISGGITHRIGKSLQATSTGAVAIINRASAIRNRGQQLILIGKSEGAVIIIFDSGYIASCGVISHREYIEITVAQLG